MCQCSIVGEIEDLTKFKKRNLSYNKPVMFLPVPQQHCKVINSY